MYVCMCVCLRGVCLYQAGEQPPQRVLPVVAVVFCIKNGQRNGKKRADTPFLLLPDLLQRPWKTLILQSLWLRETEAKANDLSVHPQSSTDLPILVGPSIEHAPLVAPIASSEQQGEWSNAKNGMSAVCFLSSVTIWICPLWGGYMGYLQMAILMQGRI